VCGVLFATCGIDCNALLLLRLEFVLFGVCFVYLSGAVAPLWLRGPVSWPTLQPISASNSVLQCPPVPASSDSLPHKVLCNLLFSLLRTGGVF
jgi:hypothetical protein